MGLRIVVLAAALTACAGASSAVVWQEIASLPQPRWFHVAGATNAHLVAFAGTTASGDRASGFSTHAMDVWSRHSSSWSTAPKAGSFKVVQRRFVRLRADRQSPESSPATTAPRQVRESEGDARLNWELPQGGVGRDGLVYWFSDVGPVLFDLDSGEWRQESAPVIEVETWKWSPPTSRTHRQNAMTAVAPDGRFFFAGGRGYPVRVHERNHKDLYSLFDLLEIYDPETRAWSIGAPMPRARQLFAGAFAGDGKLYVFGGYGHVGHVVRAEGESEEGYQRRHREMKELGRQTLNSVEVYDPARDQWEPRSPMPVGLHAMGAALGADGKIYVVGGALRYSKPRARREVLVYDPKDDTWSKGPPLRYGRFHHAVASDRAGRIYAVGGLGLKGPLASVEVLDTTVQPRPGLPYQGSAGPEWRHPSCPPTVRIADRRPQATELMFGELRREHVADGAR